MPRLLSRAVNRALNRFGMKIVPSTPGNGRPESALCGITHWRLEREYWRDVLSTFYRDEYRLELAPVQSDNAIVPSAELVRLIQSPEKAMPDAFFASGYREVFSYLSELKDYDFPPTAMNRILEFGAGLGRLIVHYWPFKAELFGCDVTKDALDWSKERLGHRVHLSCTSHEPPLSYPNGYFDFVYANSVFTHIPHKLQDDWARELVRIVRPGGYIIATVLDPNVYARGYSFRDFHAQFQLSGWHEVNPQRGVHMLTYLEWNTLRKIWGQYATVLELRTQYSNQTHVVIRKDRD